MKMDVAAEYEKIFGKKNPVNLFDSVEEYIALRQEICASRITENYGQRLPFEDFTLPAYEETRRYISMKEIGKGHHLFFVENCPTGTMKSFGAAYYSRVQGFMVLEGSFIKISPYFNYIQKCFSQQGNTEFLRNFSLKNGKLYLTHSCNTMSASLFASLVLGKKSSFEEWQDEKYKPLSDRYLYYRSSDIFEREDMTFPDYSQRASEKAEKTKVLSGILSGLKETFRPSAQSLFED